MRLESSDIPAVCDLVLDLCGISLNASKSYLIESRLGDVATKNGCESYRDLVNRVRRQADARLKREIIDAITTNETYFFRDGSPFEAFSHKALPELIDSKEHTDAPKRLRIWSAAASTGQEPYSIAISICELIPDLDCWDIQILGTDISDSAIAKASRGRFTESEVGRGMPQHLLSRYFHRSNHEWQVNDELRSILSFRTFNLHDSFVSLGAFDFIFCRNVAIYFTPEARKSLFLRMSKCLVPQGYLFVGATEILTNLGPRFSPRQHCGAVYYQPNLDDDANRVTPAPLNPTTTAGNALT